MDLIVILFISSEYTSSKIENCKKLGIFFDKSGERFMLLALMQVTV